MYITTVVGNKPPRQLSFEELFDAMISTNWMSSTAYPVREHRSHRVYTKTWRCKTWSSEIRAGFNPHRAAEYLNAFNERWAHIIDGNLASHYSRFYIPKQSGGLRAIDSPDEEISLAHVELRHLLESEFYATHHANAFAYVKGRSTVDAVKRHQRNESKWILKTDLSGFFPSTTLDFTMNMLSQMFPFGILCEYESYAQALRRALSICFLNGGLPMGTKISPMLTNLIMIPFDYELSKYLRDLQDADKNQDGKGRRFVYTRYADDMHISCGIEFDAKVIIERIRQLFDVFDAPYIIKDEKTHYGSTSGRNWILGVMLNRDNRITIGHKKRHTIEAMVFNYLKDRAASKPWGYEELQYLQGLLSYYKMVDADGMNALMNKYGAKFGLDVGKTIRRDMSAA